MSHDAAISPVYECQSDHNCPRFRSAEAAPKCPRCGHSCKSVAEPWPKPNLVEMTRQILTAGVKS